MEAFCLEKRWPHDDYVSMWSQKERSATYDRRVLTAFASLSEEWEPIAVELTPPDTPLLDVQWFGSLGPVLDDQAGDPFVRELLGRTGEWLPLAGEATGQSWNHSLSEVSVCRDDCVEPKWDHVIWAFEQAQIIPDAVQRVLGLGHVWFEAQYANGLREYINEQRLTGIGFLKCWDDTGTYEFNKGWRHLKQAGVDVWS